jgi:hypothetical protein
MDALHKSRLVQRVPQEMDTLDSGLPKYFRIYATKWAAYNP